MNAPATTYAVSSSGSAIQSGLGNRRARKTPQIVATVADVLRMPNPGEGETVAPVDRMPEAVPVEHAGQAEPHEHRGIQRLAGDDQDDAGRQYQQRRVGRQQPSAAEVQAPAEKDRRLNHLEGTNRLARAPTGSAAGPINWTMACRKRAGFRHTAT